jgi:glutaredoxin
MADVRMYVARSCPQCAAAKQFFSDRGISVEAIEVGFDPLLQAGIRAISNGQGLGVPITISFATQETIVGNDPAHLQPVVDAILGNRPVAPNAPPN